MADPRDHPQRPLDLRDDPFTTEPFANGSGGQASSPTLATQPVGTTGLGPGDETELDLKEYLWLLWARRWLVLATTALVVTASVLWTMTQEERFQASTTISIDARAPQIIRRSQLLIGPSPWEQAMYINEQERVLRSYDLATQTAKRIGLDTLGDSGASRLLGMLNIKPVADTSIVNLSMTGPNPDQVAEWLNLYVEEYISYNIEDSMQRTQQVYNVIQDRLQPLREQLNESERLLTSFKKKEDSLLSADQDKNVISEQVNTLTTELANAKTERIRLETKILSLEEVLSTGISAADVPEILNDASVKALTEQRNQLEIELQKSLQTYRDEHPVIKDLRGRLASVEQGIEAQVASAVNALRLDYQIMKRREQTLLRSLEQLRDESIELSRQTLEYDSLKRAYDQNKSFYENLLARSKEAEISGSVSYNRVRIIDKARPPGAPISPNMPRSVSAALLLGIGIGISLVLFLNYLDRSLRTPIDIKRSLGVDVFAMVPAKAEVSKRLMLEVYQSLRTALLFASRSNRCQVLLVASAGPGEGKTTTVYNLANVLAAAGSSVLVIDGDLRKPRLHKIHGTKREPGLSSLVLGERSLDEVLRYSKGNPTVQLITSGALPPNPPALFGNPAFRQLLDQLRKRFDWVILDSAPIISVTDSVVCSAVVDMVLLVVEYGRLDRKVVEGAIHQLARAGATIVGAVLNRVDMEKKVYYYDSSYYSYYYGDEPYGEQTAADDDQASSAT